MINVILQVDSHETLQDLKRFAEAYTKGLKIKAEGNQFTHDITSKNGCAYIEFYELQYNKITNVEFCELDSTELVELFNQYNDTEATAEIVHAIGDNEYLRAEIAKLRNEIEK